MTSRAQSDKMPGRLRKKRAAAGVPDKPDGGLLGREAGASDKPDGSPDARRGGAG